MQKAILLAAALMSLMTPLALTATAARADQWCGSGSQKDAVVQCGYSTVSQCEDAVGKGGRCFVDPDVARDFTPIKLAPPDPQGAKRNAGFQAS